MSDLNDLRYPIGRFQADGHVTPDRIADLITDVDALPARLRAATLGLSPDQMDTPYRPDGWTVRQVVHHVTDSHLNAYCRFKLALTEEEPVIKPYDEGAWAQLPDQRVTPPEVSLAILEPLHRRWVDLLRSMGVVDFSRTYRHPQHDRAYRLDEALGLYAWHGRHHVAHITGLRDRMGW